MNNNNLATERLCIWEEKNSIGPLTNCESKNELETNDTILSTEEKLESETSNDITKKWARKCPKCGKMIYYANKMGLDRATKNNSGCEKCRSNSVADIRERKCPSCECLLYYKNKYDRNRAEKKKLLCISCVQKSYVHQLKHKVLERKCPQCGDVVKHKNRSNMLRSWRKNKICKHCMRKRLGKANYNPKACEYFDKLSKEKGWELKHALNGGEHSIEIGPHRYWLDAYDQNRNIVVEYDEPLHYDKLGQLRDKDLRRQNRIISFLKCQLYRFNEITGQLNIFSLSRSKEVNPTG